MNRENWEKEFDEMYPNGIVIDSAPVDVDGHRTVADIAYNIKSFIRSEVRSAYQAGHESVLSELKAELPEKEKAFEPDESNGDDMKQVGFINGFNSCLSQVQTLINKKKGGV